MVLRKLKRLLGLNSSEDGGSSERDVTVQSGAENEAAVKGVDTDDDGGEPVAAGTDADASTESLVDEEEAQAEAAGRAEPAEAAGPGAEQESTDVEDADPEVDEPDAEKTVEDEVADAEAEEEEETADEAAAADEAEADDDGTPVDEIKGIGPAYSERLGEIGIHTVADLAAADAADVAEQTTAPEKTVQKWIDRANDAA